MSCPACRHDNRPGAKFCEDCAAPLKCACASCGAELRPTAKFCDECGTAVATSAAQPQPRVGTVSARKVVTTIFADLAGSTALHERVDAESARRLMERYYETLRGAVEEHGGTVVKLLGDGVMAAFGVPQVAEDDAVRAVRAGVAMQDAFRTLVGEQTEVLGDVGLRVAINTGEVIVADTNDDIVGDPVNIAARLQEEAGDGDVVIGGATQRLVASLVTLAPLGSFTLKGRTEAVTAYRVVSLERPAGVAATPFVGRDAELARIEAVYDAATSKPAAQLAVLLGSPGLGKSRLIDEFSARLGDRTSVITAHCDAAGGVTFAPLAKAFRDFFAVGDGDALRTAIESSLPSGESERMRIADGVALLLAGTPAEPEETFYIVRRWLAALARRRPVVLVIDDLQWAEPLLLDLIEHLVQWGKDVPLLVLVGARSELRDTRASLVTPGGLVNDVLTLDGLDAGAAMRLAAHVVGASDLPAAVAAKVLASSEGNPLFVGELVRMLVDEGVLARQGDRWVVGEGLTSLEMPPTIQALLASRIERLRPEDRMILERAAVVGRQFSRSAVAELLPGDAADLDARLEALRRTELIESDTGWFLGEPALCFHHVLIRDAAYQRLLKETRADLHARFADWVEARSGDAVEHEETIGRHLEQAYQLLGELGPIDAAAQALGQRAAARLAPAGRRALAREDVSLAANLLGRALECLNGVHPDRADLVLDLCEALLSAGDVVPAAAVIDELGRFAEDSERLRAWHTCFVGQLTALTAPESLQATADAVATAAEQLASLDDAAGEAKAHFVLAQTLARLGKVGACEAALDRALAAARRAGDRRRANAVLAGAPMAALWGPSPVTRASGRCLDVVRVLRITQGAPAVEAIALSCQGVLEALRGRTDAARRMVASSREMVEELGITHRLFETDVFAAQIDLLEGDPVSAERGLRRAYEGLRDLGLGIDAARASALLARALLAQDRAGEAEELSHECEALAGDDLQAAIAWRCARAEALARRGETASAVEFAEAAVAIAAATDALLDHADARLALAAALRAAGRDGEAEAEERRAMELWQIKGATILADRPRNDAAAVTPEPRQDDQVRTSDGSVRRRVRSNAAVTAMARIDAALAAHEEDAMRAWCADGYELHEHPTGVSMGVEGVLESIKLLQRSQEVNVGHEPLAVLGERFGLFRRSVRAAATGGGKFDVGEYENAAFSVFEVDAQGLLAHGEVFGTAHLNEAVACLYQRYAEGLADSPKRDGAMATANSAAAVLGFVSIDRLVSVLADNFEQVDHRLLGTWRAHDAEELLTVMRSMQEVSTDFTLATSDILDLAPRAVLAERLHTGTALDSVGGGPYERVFLMMTAFAPDGRVVRNELFDCDDRAEALARFDELVGNRVDAPLVVGARATELFENAALARLAELDAVHEVGAATAHPFAAAWARIAKANLGSVAMSRWKAAFDIAFETDDWAPMRALCAPGMTFEDRRRMALLSGDAELMIASARERTLVGANVEIEMMGTAGDRVVISRMLWSGGPPEGRFEIEYCAVMETDASGFTSAVVLIDLDDTRAAQREAWARWAAIDPVAKPWVDFVSTSIDSFNERDIDVFRTLFAENVIVDDRRRTGMGRIDGVDAYSHSVTVLRALAPDTRMELGWYWPTYDREVAVMTIRRTGMIVDGGPFESDYLVLCAMPEGVVTRMEMFEIDALDAALARAEALRCDPARGRGNGSA